MAEEQKQQRELCPNLTSTQDLVNQIGGLSVDILNKEKVLLELWNNIDEITAKVTSLSEQVLSLTTTKEQHEDAIKHRDAKIVKLREERSNLLSVHEGKMQKKDDEIRNLQKTLKGIEAEAVINQEEVRKELMVTRNELSALKESIKSKPKRAKKKTDTKPARA